MFDEMKDSGGAVRPLKTYLVGAGESVESAAYPIDLEN
jgi:hypothetical protein